MECNYCDGTAAVRTLTGLSDCPVCDGTGEIPDHWNKRPECKRCNGNGRLKFIDGIGKCHKCDGIGRVPPPKSEDSSVWLIEAGQPYRTHRQLAEFFSTLAGDIFVCDKSCGLGSLECLASFTECSTLRFLTQQPDNKEKSFLPNSLKEFLVAHPNVEIQRYQGSNLHDRYVLSKDRLIILGHGLNSPLTKSSLDEFGLV